MRVTWIVLLAAAAALAWFLLDDRPPEAPALERPDAPPTPDATAPGPGLAGSGQPGATAHEAGEGRYLLRVLVQDEAELPVAGIPVEVQRTVVTWPATGYRANLEFNRVNITETVRTLLAGGRQALEFAGAGVSDAQGRLVLRLDRPGSHHVFARPDPPRAAGHASAYLIEGTRESADVVLTVVDGAALEGRVQDARGQPVRARVRVTRRGFRDEVESDEAGAFRFAVVARGEVGLAVVLPSGREVSGFAATVPATAPVVLTLPDGSATIAGTVSSPDGRGVPGALVHVLLLVAPLDGSQRKARLGLAATTDANGRYAFADLPPGELGSVQATAAGFLPHSLYAGAEGWVDTAVPDGVVTTLDIALRHGSAIHGRVTTQGEGVPLEGATVTLYFLGWHPPAQESVLTDAQGRYRFEGIANGSFFLLASHPTHFSPELEAACLAPYAGTRRAPPEHLALVLPLEDQALERDLVLSPGRALSGRVVDPEGEPVAGAGVFLHGHGLARGGHAWGLMMHGDVPSVAVTDADGAFALDGLAPRVDWVLFARKKGFAAQESAPIDLSEGPATDVVLHLLPPCTLRGHVLDADGTPLPDRSIFASGMSTLRGGDWHFTSRADGSFEIDSMPAAMIDLSTRQGEEGVELRVTGLVPGEVREGLVLQFGSKAEVTGRVTDRLGAPVAGLQVLLSAANPISHVQLSGRTDADGMFRIGNVPAGEARLYMRGETGATTWLTDTFTAPARDLAITYDRPSRVQVRGVVLGPEGERVPRCTLSVHAGKGGGAREREVTDGAFEVTITGEAPYTLVVQRPLDANGRPLNLRGSSVPIEDVTQPLTVRLEPGGTLRGTVLDAEGQPVPNVTVTTQSNLSTTTGVDGAWALTGLPAERVILQFAPPSPFVRPAPQLLWPDAATMETRLVRGTRISGRVIVPEGLSIQGGQVEVRWDAVGAEAAGRAHATLNSAGTFVVTGLPIGRRVSVTLTPWTAGEGGPRIARVTVDGIEAGATDLEIPLQVGLAVGGVVVGADGRPRAGVRVGSQYMIGTWPLTDAQGAFRAEGLPPGATTLRVLDPEGPLLTTVEVTAPASGVRIVVPDRGAIAGRIVGGPPEAAWSLYLADPATGAGASGVNEVEVHGNGSWVLESVVKGSAYVVTARLQDSAGLLYARSGPVEAGARDVELRPVEGATIAGRVTRDGVGLPQASVTARGPGWTSSAGTDDDGRFHLRGLPPGTYSLDARHWVLRTHGRVEGIVAGASGVEIAVDQPE